MGVGVRSLVATKEDSPCIPHFLSFFFVLSFFFFSVLLLLLKKNIAKFWLGKFSSIQFNSKPLYSSNMGQLHYKCLSTLKLQYSCYLLNTKKKKKKNTNKQAMKKSLQLVKKYLEKAKYQTCHGSHHSTKRPINHATQKSSTSCQSY